MINPSVTQSKTDMKGKWVSQSERIGSPEDLPGLQSTSLARLPVPELRSSWGVMTMTHEQPRARPPSGI